MARHRDGRIGNRLKLFMVFKSVSVVIRRGNALLYCQKTIKTRRIAWIILWCAGESDAEIVAGAWDLERINRRYARHLKILGERPGGALRNAVAAKSLLRWAAAEREAWLEAVTNDPLLPFPS